MFARGIGCPLPDTQHFQISNKSEPGFQGSDLIPNWWCFGNDRAAPHAVGSFSHNHFPETSLCGRLGSAIGVPDESIS
jgi:hypothetical protein